MFKFSLKEYVKTEDNAIGMITGRQEAIDGENLYDVSFIDNETEMFNERALMKTKEKQPTDIDGRSLAEVINEELKEKREKLAEQNAKELMLSILAIKERYHNKCANDKAFWEFYEEDLEAIIYAHFNVDLEAKKKKEEDDLERISRYFF